jgi:cell division protein FtsZ
MKGAKGVIISITGGEDMRLMEVDEAANHIRELVDPDANIIWGSACNNDLDGKIRVSVVATGIEVDVATMPEPAKSFSFAPRTPLREDRPVAVPQQPAPVAEEPIPAPAPVTEAVEEEEKIVLEAPEPAVQPAAEPTSLFTDELLLEPEAVVPQAPAPAEPAADTSGNRRWVAEPEAERPRPASHGATLFERMSNIARGAAKAQVDSAEPAPSQEGGDIPRFLNRQSNQ